MTFDFFEGAAGTGKTHNLVGRAGEIVQDGVLGEGHKLLALTFMNGARRRLDARLGENPAFRRRFDCQTFDVFARTLAARRRSLITQAMRVQADALNQFDRPCALAAGLLEQGIVRRWVARSFPLVLVDEAQDLDEHRLRILRGLAPACRIVAAADAFQCLHNGRDTTPLMGWLEGAGQTHRLTQVRRTNEQGLLAAALAVREGRDVKTVLTARTFNNRTSWNGAGFRLLDVPVTNANHALLAWAIANDIAQRQGPVVILTPDAGNAIIRATLNTVQTKQHTRKNSGATFGPYPHTWDRHDNEEADALLADIALPEMASCANLRALSDRHPSMRFVLENHDGASLDPQVCLDVLAAVDRPNVRMNFDPINFERAGVDGLDAARLLAPFVGHVHLKGLQDGEFCEFGVGDVDLAPVLAVLDAAGFSGAFSVEYEGSFDKTLRLYQSVKRARAMIEGA